jgi:hypothetical protein
MIVCKKWDVQNIKRKSLKMIVRRCNHRWLGFQKSSKTFAESDRSVFKHNTVNNCFAKLHLGANPNSVSQMTKKQ